MASSIDVAIITCKRLPEVDSDEPVLLAALASAGLTAQMVPWDAEPRAFPNAKIQIVRSTWNYYHALDSFLAWTAEAERRAPLHNGADIIRWNTDKAYLRDLTARGIAVVPTAYVDVGSTEDLSELMQSRGWDDVVVKPRISAGSFATTRHLLDDLHGGEITRAASERALMVQPYVKTVDGRGERSYIFIDGEPTHAMRKSPRLAGQAESVQSVPLDEVDVAFARRVLEVAASRSRTKLLYARVDIARDDRDAPMVMEVELVEPSLFFTHAPQALTQFVRAVGARVAAANGASHGV